MHVSVGMGEPSGKVFTDSRHKGKVLCSPQVSGNVCISGNTSVYKNHSRDPIYHLILTSSVRDITWRRSMVEREKERWSHLQQRDWQTSSRGRGTKFRCCRGWGWEASFVRRTAPDGRGSTPPPSQQPAQTVRQQQAEEYFFLRTYIRQ